METKAHATLLGEKDLDRVPWGHAADAELARTLFSAGLTEGPAAFVPDANASFRLMDTGAHLLPLVIPDDTAGEAAHLLFSNYARYILGPLAVIDEVLQGAVKKRAARAALASFGWMLRQAGIDRCVHVNHWLMTVGPVPPLTTSAVEAVTRVLQKEYPDRVILFRTFIPDDHPVLRNALRANGYRLVWSGFTNVFHPSSTGLSSSQRWQLRRDQRLLEESDYDVMEHEDFEQSHAPRLLELYEMLNLRKHAGSLTLSLRFFEGVIRNRWLRLRGIQRDGQLDGFSATVDLGYEIWSAMGGYDTDKPAAAGLYRMVSAQIFDLSLHAGTVLDVGPGANDFKELRGCRPSLTFTAAFVDHLPYARRLAWEALIRVIDAVHLPVTRGAVGIPAGANSADQTPRGAAPGDSNGREGPGGSSAAEESAAPPKLSRIDIPAAEPMGNSAVVVGDVGDASPRLLRETSDRIRSQLGSVALLLAAKHRGRVILLAAMSPDLVDRGLSAAELIAETSPIVGSTGGGRAAMAHGGGRNVGESAKALMAGRLWLRDRLVSDE